MSALIVKSPESALITTIGGVPRAPEGTAWPVCKACSGAMQFLASLHLPEVAPEIGSTGTLLLFQCQNDPGLCDEWDAHSGGNRAMLVDTGTAVPLRVPVGPTILSSTMKVALEPWGDGDLDAYLAAVTSRPSIVGKSGGTPTWLQSDETPECSCGQLMQFVAQIDSAASEDINFGDGGIGYSFICPVCPSEVKFLWQCL